MSSDDSAVDADPHASSIKATGTFSLVLICTGNICRSPAAEVLFLEAWKSSGSTIDVSSAGTRASSGLPIDPRMKALLPANDRVDAFAARQLDQRIVAEADLVLTMTRQHRSAVALMHAPSLRYAFTLQEFARIISCGVSRADDDAWLDHSDNVDDRLSAAVRRALIDRVKVNSSQVQGADDVGDPYGRPAEAFAAAFAEIERAVRTITDFTSR